MRKSDASFELKNLKEKIYRRYIAQINKTTQVICLNSIDKILIETIRPKEINDEHYWKDCVYWLIHTILNKTLNEDFKNSRSSYVGLNYAELKKVLGSDVKKVINTLESHGIIKKDNRYKKGRESFGYKITTKYFKNNELHFKTITSPLLEKRLLKYRLDYYIKQKPLISKNAHLVKWFIEDGLDYNVEAGDYFIKALKEALKLILVYGNLKLKRSDKQKIISKIDWLDYYNDFSIKGKLPVFSLNGDRLYSEITSMYSPLRNFLSFKGERLVYFDIRNSQPFHFNLLLTPKFWKEKDGELTLRNQNNELFEWIKENNNKELDATIMNLKQHDSPTKTPTIKGIQRKKSASPHYGHLSATGKLYLFINEIFKGKFTNDKGTDPFADADSTKKEFIKMFYYDDNNKYSPSNKYFLEFKKYFKIEASVIQLLKKRKHNDFSVLLQQVEATILLQNVCKSVYIENSDIPMYSIHDGVLTTEKYSELLKNKINQVYMSYFGFSPELKEEIFSPKIPIYEFREIVKKKLSKILKNLNVSDFSFSPEFVLKIDMVYIKYYSNH